MSDTNDTNVVQVTGRGSKVDLTIDDAISFDEVEKGLHGHLLGNSYLYSSGTITVNVGRRMLEKEQLTKIKELLERESGVTVSSFWCLPEVLQQALSESVGFGVRLAAEEPRRAPQPREIVHNDPAWLPSTPEPNDAAPPGFDKRKAHLREPQIGAAFSEGPVTPNRVEPATEFPEDQPDPVPEIEAANSAENVANGDGPPAADFETGETGPSTETALPVQSAMPGFGVSARPPGADAEVPPEPSAGKPASPGSQPTVGPASLSRAQAKPATNGLNRGNEALLIKTNCRSGEVIRYSGDVVVLADVNPGAEIIADGDILVFGRLRGFAHAGAGGDEQATIVASQLESYRLQIGPHVGIEPGNKNQSKSNRASPKIAYVRRRSVFVAPYVGRFGGYNGGILYDG